MKGCIYIDGTPGRGPELIRHARRDILEPAHRDPAVAASRKVLLVTAGWHQEEFHETHIKREIYELGVAPHIRGAREENVQNLSLYHEFDKLRAADPRLAEAYRAKQETCKQLMALYRRTNRAAAALMEQHLLALGSALRRPSLIELLDRPPSRSEDWTELEPYAAEELAALMERIRHNDRWILRRLDRLEAAFRRKVSLVENPRWRATRALLERRIRESATIVLFGGHLGVLFNRLRFFDLAPAFVRALDDGATIVARGAGAMVLADRVVTFHDTYRGGEHRFEVFGNGLGLITRFLILPDFTERIDVGRTDRLALRARRFWRRTCVGLDRGAVLKMETRPHGRTEREHFVSLGPEGTITLVGPDGRVRPLKPGESIRPATRARRPRITAREEVQSC